DAETTGREAAQRRADAVGLIAERALAAGFGGAAEEEENEAARAAADPEALAASPSPPPAPISGSRAERYQVVLHVDAETLRADGGTGRSELEDGTRVSYETSRRLSCDAGLVRAVHGPGGSLLDVGRKTRTIP